MVGQQLAALLERGGDTWPVRVVRLHPVEARRPQVENCQPKVARWKARLTGTSSAFSPDGSLLAFNDSRDKTVHLWDVATGRPAGPPITGRSSELHGMRFSPDGTTLAVGDTYLVQLWDVASRQLVREHGPECSGVSKGDRHRGQVPW